MSRVRFATARDLFEDFPMAGTLISSEPTDEFPLDYLRNLVAKGKIDDAVTCVCRLIWCRAGGRFPGMPDRGRFSATA